MFNNETSIPTDGLVYKADLDGGVPSGSTASNVTWVGADKGYVEEVGSFNGSSSKIEMGSFRLPGGSIYMSFNINFNEVTSIQRPLSGANNGATEYGWNSVLFEGNLNITNYRADVINNFDLSFIGVQANVNYFIEIMWDGTTTINGVKMYANGILVDETTALTATTNQGIKVVSLGVLTTLATQWLNGKMGLVRIYNRILDESERNSLFLEGQRQLGPSNAPLSGNFPFYSLDNLEQGKVLEISRPQKGGVYVDDSANGNDGTPTSVTDSTNGLHNVMSFNGSSSYITEPISVINTDLQGEPCIGYAFTVKRSSTGGTQDVIFGQTSSNNTGIQLAFRSANDFLVGGRSQTADSYQFGLSTSIFTDTTKTYRFFCLFDYVNDKIRIYVNGVKESETTVSFGATSLNFTANLFRIGNSAGSSYLNGDVNDLIIYKRDATDEEILEDFYKSKII